MGNAWRLVGCEFAPDPDFLSTSVISYLPKL